MEGRVLFIGGIPWDSPAEGAAAAIRRLCPQATHVALKDPHRGWALAAFRGTAAAGEAAAALGAAAAAGMPELGAALTVAPALRVPTSWPAEWMMTAEEAEAARRQKERADEHHARMKRRRQRQKEEMLEELRAVLSGLGAVLDLRSGDAPPGDDPPGDAPGDTRGDAVGGGLGGGGGGGATGALLGSGAAAGQDENGGGSSSSGDGTPLEAVGSDFGGISGSGSGSGSGSRAAAAAGGGVWAQYSPLLSDLAADWRAGGGGGGGGDDGALAALLERMPARLRRAVRPGQLRRALEAAAGTSGHPAPPPGPVSLATAPSADAVAAALWFDWSTLPAAVDPALGGMLADADVVRAGGGRMNLRALRKRVQVEGFALALLQLLPRARRRADARRARRADPRPPLEHSGGRGCDSHSWRRNEQGEATRSTTSLSPAHLDDGAGEPIWVVDFGSGGGNLTLPLAWLFESAGCRFVAVDLKPAAIDMVARRASEAGLSNLEVIFGAIEDYEGPADVVLALHACGAATDVSMQQAAARGAAFVVSPCCIGKVNLGGAVGATAAAHGGAEGGASAAAATGAGRGGRAPLPPLLRPRSRRLGRALACLTPAAREAGGMQDVPSHNPQKDGAGASAGDGAGGVAAAAKLFAALARVADFSHQEDHGYPDLAAAAKAHVELDRALAAEEAGYAWRLARLPQAELTAKNDVIVGWPRCDDGSQQQDEVGK